MAMNGGITMNTELIGQHWDGIGEKELELVETFYERLFERHPRFRSLFPATMSHQAEKMVQTLALMAKHSDDAKLLHPHLERIGGRHQHYGLAFEDFEDFLAVLMEVMSEYNAKAWSPQCEAAWREAFRRVVLPAMAPKSAKAM